MTPHTTVATKRREAIGRSIASLDGRLTDARNALSASSLDLVDKPDDPDLLGELDRLEDTVDRLERERARLLLAEQEAGRQLTAAEREARIKAMKAGIKRVDDLGAQMVALAEKIVEGLDAVSPLLAEFEALSKDRSAISWDIFREGTPARRGERWESLRTYAGMERGPVSVAIAAAAWRCGLGRIGPNLDAWFTSRPTQWDSPYPRNEPLRELLRVESAAEAHKLAGVLHRTVAAVEGAE